RRVPPDIGHACEGQGIRAATGPGILHGLRARLAQPLHRGRPAQAGGHRSRARMFSHRHGSQPGRVVRSLRCVARTEVVSRPGGAGTRVVNTMKIAICQLPNELSHDGLDWKRFVRRIERAQPDVTVLNEIPFGPWISREPAFDEYLAAESIEAHAAALPALHDLPGAVIASRPVRNRDRL